MKVIFIFLFMFIHIFSIFYSEDVFLYNKKKKQYIFIVAFPVLIVVPFKVLTLEHFPKQGHNKCSNILVKMAFFWEFSGN